MGGSGSLKKCYHCCVSDRSQVLFLGRRVAGEGIHFPKSLTLSQNLLHMGFLKKTSILVTDCYANLVEDVGLDTIGGEGNHIELDVTLYSP